MTASRTYALDANVFIEAHRRYYAFDLAPPFWQMLIDHASNGQVLSIDRVGDELKRGNDELANWASSSFHEFFVSTSDEEVIAAYRQIMVWSQSRSGSVYRGG